MLGGTSEKLQEAYYKIVADCCDYAQAKGVGLSVKPHGGSNASGAQCRKIIDRIGHKNFRIWYDPGNIFFYSDGKLDPVDDAAAVDGVVIGMSVKDFRPPKDVDVTPGTGKVDFAKVLARLKQGGFTCGPLVVECLAPGDLAHLKGRGGESPQAPGEACESYRDRMRIGRRITSGFGRDSPPTRFSADPMGGTITGTAPPTLAYHRGETKLAASAYLAAGLATGWDGFLASASFLAIAAFLVSAAFFACSARFFSTARRAACSAFSCLFGLLPGLGELLGLLGLFEGHRRPANIPASALRVGLQLGSLPLFGHGSRDRGFGLLGGCEGFLASGGGFCWAAWAACWAAANRCCAAATSAPATIFALKILTFGFAAGGVAGLVTAFRTAGAGGFGAPGLAFTGSAAAAVWNIRPAHRQGKRKEGAYHGNTPYEVGEVNLRRRRREHFHRTGGTGDLQVMLTRCLRICKRIFT